MPWQQSCYLLSACMYVHFNRVLEHSIWSLHIKSLPLVTILVILSVQKYFLALQYLQSSRHLNGRLTRWALQLQHYDFVIKYRPGKSHQNADGLSRQAWVQSEDVEDSHTDEDVMRGDVSGSP